MRKRILIACAAILLAACNCPKAHADPSDQPGPDPAVVGGMYDAGVPPAEIPHDIIRNNPRLNSPTLPWQVFRDLQNH